MRLAVVILVAVACGGRARPPADREPAPVVYTPPLEKERMPVAPACLLPEVAAAQPRIDLHGCSEAPLDDGGPACAPRWRRAREACVRVEAACAHDGKYAYRPWCERAEYRCGALLCDACACVSGPRWPLTL
jgi:hypothetical protein